MEKINKERIEMEVQELLLEADLAEKNCKLLSDLADKHITTVFPILKRRGIEVVRSQMYFNNSFMETKPFSYKRALLHLYFKEPLTDLQGKNLSKILRIKEIPLTIQSFKDGLEISIQLP